MKKYFIITVDTEGDNLWEYKKGQLISTNNSRYIPRFQELCIKYDYKPVWLTNYEMANDDFFVGYMSEILEERKCEVGIHLHAWNNPPLYDLNGNYKGNPYLIEYPISIRHDKFKFLFDFVTNKFKKSPISHRAGRWVTDGKYFHLLEEFGIKVDCSYTPGISWLKTCGETVEGGCDYRLVKNEAHYVGNILEVPVSIRHFHRVNEGNIVSKIKAFLKGRSVWLRPATTSLPDMLRLIDKVQKEPDCDYVEFMIHSSELMPGGSPYFKTNEDIENLYVCMNNLFSYALNIGYKGVTLEEYYILKG